MTKHLEDDVQLLREDLMGELKAINDYQKHIDVLKSDEAKHVLEHIRDDEKEHFAELTKLVRQMDGTQEAKFKKEEL